MKFNSTANTLVKSFVPSTDGHGYPLYSLAWPGSPIVDACAVQADYGKLLVLTADGCPHGVDCETGTCVVLTVVNLPVLTNADEKPHIGGACHRLLASSDGRYAAIVVDEGREGLVVDVRSGTVTMRLNGGDYHPETVPFSACFLRYQGRDVFVHRTAWNRLDVSEPATGKSMTERDIAPYQTPPDRPAHNLDYFHGQLWPSPDGDRLFDDGWVWAPVSIPRVWSVTEWLGSNPWESEDGASVVNLMARDDWNTPACWLGHQHVALWGLGVWDDDEGAETGHGPGVRIFDGTEKQQSSERRWSMEPVTSRVLNLFSDGIRLYVAAQAGTTAWDIASGKQIADVEGFVARVHDLARNTLVAIAPNAITELALPWPDGSRHTAR